MRVPQSFSASARAWPSSWPSPACPFSDCRLSTRRHRRREPRGRPASAGCRSTKRSAWRSSRTSDLQVERINPQIAGPRASSQARGQLDADASTTYTGPSQSTQPTQRCWSGGINQDHRPTSSALNVGLKQSLPVGRLLQRRLQQRCAATTNNMFNDSTTRSSARRSARSDHAAAAAQLQDRPDRQQLLVTPQEPRDLRRRSCSRRSR